MAAYKVEICGVTTSKLPILKEEEKNILFEKIKKGDNLVMTGFGGGMSAGAILLKA